MSILKKKFIPVLDGSKVVFENDQAIKAKKADGSEQDIIKIDSSDDLKFIVLPKLPVGAPSDDSHVVRKDYVDSEIADEALARSNADAGLSSRLDTAESALQVIQGSDSVEGSVAKAEKDAKDYADQKVADLVGSSPELLNTLQELANAINNDAGFATTISQTLGELDGRLDTIEGGSSVTGSIAHAVDGERVRAESAEQILDGRLDVLEGNSSVVGSVDNKISVAQQSLQSSIDAVDGRVDALDLSVVALDDRLVIAEDDIAAIETQLAGLANNSAIQALDSRLTTAEGDINALEGRMDSAESSIGLKASQTDLDALEGRMDSAESSIALKASQADLDSVEGRVDTAESDIDSLESRMGSAESALSSLASSSAIVELDGRIDVLEAAMPLKAAQSDLEQEIQDREDADAALGVRIDNILSNTTPGSLDSLVEVVQAFEQADQNLNNAITSLASSASSALQSEVARATQAEQALSDAIALKVAQTYVDAQDQVILAAAKDYSDELAAGMTYQREFHVNFDFTGTSDGSPVRPFKTIQAAVDAAIADNSGANNHIMVHNKGNTVISENIVINNANQNLFIEGMAHVKDGYAVRIDGSISIQGNSSRVRLKGLQVMSPNVSTPALTVVGTPGRHIFEKCAFEVGGVAFSGSYANWLSFEDCSFDGPVSFAGTPAANTLITMYRSFAGGADVVVNSANVIVSIMDTYSMKSITHSAGTVAVDNLRSIGSAGIVSTASAGLLSLTRVSMQQPDLSFAPINKSGTAFYQLISVHRGETADTLSGTRVSYGPTATDQGYKMGVSGNWASAVYAVGPALDSLAANKASSASVTSGLAGKASTSLNNLASVAINADLLPAASGARSVGSVTLGFGNIYSASIRPYRSSGALSINTVDDGRTCAIDMAGVVTLSSHGFNLNQSIFFFGTLPSGLSSSSIYYVKSVVDTNSFTISSTVGGAQLTFAAVSSPSVAPVQSTSISARGPSTLSVTGGKTVSIGPSFNSNAGGTMSINSIGAALTIGALSGGTTTFNSTAQFQHGTQWNQFTRLGVSIGNLNKYTDQDGVSMFGLWHQDAAGTPYSGINTDDKASVNSGGIKLRTGDATAGSYDSGEILLKTGASAGGTRGRVKLDGSYIDASSAKISNVASPAVSSDAATKGYTDQQRDEAKAYTDAQLDGLTIQVQQYESKTLGAQDITNGYVDVAQTIVGTPWVMVDGIMARPGQDFSFSGSRITWLNEYAVGGSAPMEANDTVHIFYMKNSSPFA